MGPGRRQRHTVNVAGTNRADDVDVRRSGDQVAVDGLPAATRITGSEVADTLKVSTRHGNDDVLLAPDVKDLLTPLIDLGLGEVAPGGARGRGRPRASDQSLVNR